MGMRNAGKVNGGGEIVQVQGGHILRSINRKDRHSKVYTSKGPRDRRIRLAAHTAIQFYDVQDRLGYDRPSKAVDWLIKNAKSAIDKLDELPPWLPNVCTINTEQQQSDSSGFVPTSLEPDTFFPTTSVDFPSYPHDFILNSANKPQNLNLSLQSYQHPDQDSNNLGHQTEQTIFAVPENVGFEPNSDEFGRFSRMMSWNNDGLFNSPAMNHHHNFTQLLSGQVGSDFSQRGTLQSSFNMPEIYRNSTSGHPRFVSEGFSGFCMPARIHGDEEHDDETSSASLH